MSSADCAAPIGWARLVAYWFDDADSAEAARVDEHLLGCDHCGCVLDQIIALGNGVRHAFAAGQIGVFITTAFAERLAKRGLRLRNYRVAAGGSVDCSVDPDDDLVLGRLQVPLQGVRRLDLLSHWSSGPPDQRAEDIPFDAAAAEVVVVPPLAHLRRMPAHVQRISLVAVDESGERVLGNYTFVHCGVGPAT